MMLGDKGRGSGRAPVPINTPSMRKESRNPEPAAYVAQPRVPGWGTRPAGDEKAVQDGAPPSAPGDAAAPAPQPALPVVAPWATKPAAAAPPEAQEEDSVEIPAAEESASPPREAPKASTPLVMPVAPWATPSPGQPSKGKAEAASSSATGAAPRKGPAWGEDENDDPAQSSNDGSAAMVPLAPWGSPKLEAAPPAQKVRPEGYAAPPPP